MIRRKQPTASKPTAYLVRLKPHHAEKLSRHARDANLSPNQFIRDRVIAILDGADPAERRHLTAVLSELKAEVRQLRGENAEMRQALDTCLGRIDWILSRVRPAPALGDDG